MKTTLTLILFSISLCMSLTATAQEEENDSPPTFLETVLEGRDLSIAPSWNWTLLPEHTRAYEIEITAPATWASAHLCVDGHSLKTIKPAQNPFKWSFAKLGPGAHTVTLVVIDADGNAGTVSRELN